MNIKAAVELVTLCNKHRGTTNKDPELCRTFEDPLPKLKDAGP